MAALSFLAGLSVARFAFALVLALSLDLLPVMPLNAQEVQASQSRSRLTLVLNKSRNVKLPNPYADATVGSPDIADIVPMSDRQLYIVGKKVGTTNVLLYDNEKRLIGVIDVIVKMDTGALGEEIRGAASAPDVRVQDVDGKVVLKGTAPDAPAIHRAMRSATGIGAGPPMNALKLNANHSQQVLLKVRFVEADRGAVRALGVRWQGILNNRVGGVVGPQAAPNSTLRQSGLFSGAAPWYGGFAGPNNGLARVPGGAAGAQNTTGLTPGGIVYDVLTNSLTGASPVATIIAQLVNTSRGSLDVVISALEDQGVLRRLAEPNLVALSGQSAEFLAGGEFPVPVVQGSGSALNAFAPITIQWKEYGVRLNFTPTVLADRVISLNLMPSVSDLDYQNAITYQGTVIPSLIKRTAQTTVELRDGQTFAIAGLIQAKSIRDIEQVPWLGSVPVLGALFRSTQFQAQETELVALVTPHLVEPVPPGNKDPRLKTPLDTSLAGNDIDFFLGGAAEVPKTTQTYVTPTGVEQPVQGGIAPGAPGDTPPALLSPPDALRQFLGMSWANSAAPPPAPNQ